MRGRESDPVGGRRAICRRAGITVSDPSKAARAGALRHNGNVYLFLR